MIGILGVGMYAPPQVRTNAWWPPEIVAQWRAGDRARPTLPAEITAGIRQVLDASAAFAEDPFHGVAERRILDPSMTIADMEEHAAREALARSGVSPDDVDLLLTHYVVPEYQLQNAACVLHQRLGMRHECLTLQVEATGYSLLAQLALAESALLAGRARYALLVQSCALSRVVEQAHPLSVVAGDAATAIVLGPVTGDRGLRATAHFTDSRYPMGLVIDGSRRLLMDPQQMWDTQWGTADACKRSVDVVLDRAGIAIGEIDYLCVHQGTVWLQDVVRTFIGAADAKSVEVFRQFGYLAAVAIPANLYIGEQQGRLLRDDLVLVTGGGTGQTYGAAVLRWGK